MRAGRGKLGLVVSIALISLVFAPFSAHAERTVGLSTGTFELSLAPGQIGGGEVVVSNNGDEDIDVLIYAADQLVSEDGAIDYQTPDITGITGAGTPATWVRMDIDAETRTRGNTPYVSLTPGQQVPVAFEVEVPEDAPPGDHQVIIFFEMFGGEGPDTEGATTEVTGRVGARVSMRVAGEVVERLEVRPFVTKAFVLSRLAPYTFVARNDGNIDKDIEARILVLDSDLQEVVDAVVTEDATVYAGTNFEQSGSVETPTQLLGRYTMRLEVSYPREGSEVGATDVITVDKGVWFVPLWLVIAAIVTLGGIAIWLSWRSARRADERKRARGRGRRPGRRSETPDDS